MECVTDCPDTYALSARLCICVFCYEISTLQTKICLLHSCDYNVFLMSCRHLAYIVNRAMSVRNEICGIVRIISLLYINQSVWFHACKDSVINIFIIPNLPLHSWETKICLILTQCIYMKFNNCILFCDHLNNQFISHSGITIDHCNARIFLPKCLYKPKHVP